tara:strand:+ start:520 stop:819 length:300 start_codon:yes stop_codon:yes gene_type:complete
MARSGQSRAEANREIRREALLEQLKAGGLIPQINENIAKIEDLTKYSDDWQRLNAATQLRFKLLAKLMPDVKALEHSLDPNSGPLAVNVIQYANSNAPK